MIEDDDSIYDDEAPEQIPEHVPKQTKRETCSFCQRDGGWILLDHISNINWCPDCGSIHFIDCHLYRHDVTPLFCQRLAGERKHHKNLSGEHSTGEKWETLWDRSGLHKTIKRECTE